MFDEIRENTNQAALSALDLGMEMTKQFDPDIAIDAAKELLNKFPDVVSGLPYDVANLLIDTNAGQEKIPREELQETHYEVPENPKDWTWRQVFAYYYNPR